MFREEMVEARQVGDSYRYMQVRRKLHDVQQEIERYMDPTSQWRLAMQRRRDAKRERWRRRGIKAGQPYTEEGDEKGDRQDR